MVEAVGHICQDEALLTVIISPRHLAHSMDKRTRANDNGERQTGCPRNLQMSKNITTAPAPFLAWAIVNIV